MLVKAKVYLEGSPYPSQYFQPPLRCVFVGEVSYVVHYLMTLPHSTGSIQSWFLSPTSINSFTSICILEAYKIIRTLRISKRNRIDLPSKKPIKILKTALFFSLSNISL